MLSAPAVRYLELVSQSWREFVTFNILQYGTRFAFEAEFIAVLEAFRFACGLTDNFDHLVILSDCQSVLHRIQRRSKSTSLLDTRLLGSLLRYANSLYDMGITVELRWSLAHAYVEGNEQVDELAKRFRRSAQYILIRELPDIMVKHVTVTSGSLESLRQALFENIMQRADEEKSENKAIMENAKI
ncbi:hypothetical protein GQ44DRAFT_469778 [Phaeosphaeriaceae sp. PMI808]|nr:hypothetical protein GQ44DRAFT_469778 [Phaeosphaeriaceae sp. PMI808]